MLVATMVAGCGGDATISCKTADDCIQGGIPGVCLGSPKSISNWCAFTDETCPDTHQRWGAAAGDDLASSCVVVIGPADAGPDAPIVDAGPDAELPPDGTPPPPLSTKLIVAARSQDSLFLFAADTLAPISTAPLPDRVGSGNEGIGLADGKLWVSSVQQIAALDPDAVTVLAGFPKTLDPTTACLAGTSVFRDPGIYCLVKGATGDVQLRGGSDLALLHHLALATPFTVGGSNTRVVVTFGTNGGSAAVLDANLGPVNGSPIAAPPQTSGQQQVAVDDEGGRIAIAGANVVKLFDRSTLSAAGSHTFTANVAGLVFDHAHSRLVVVLADGHVAALAEADGAVVVAESPELDATSSAVPVLDAPRGRFYLLTNNGTQLAVLDTATLHHVTGSPVTLPAQARAVTFF